MPDNLKIVYKLYAMELNRDNMRSAATERFSRATPFYILVYTNGELPENGIEIINDDKKRLTDEDERWVQDCNLIILAEQAKKNETKIAQDMQKRLEQMEQILEQAKKDKEG